MPWAMVRPVLSPCEGAKTSVIESSELSDQLEVNEGIHE